MSVYLTSQIGGWSTGGYSNPKYDQLYEQQRTTLDKEKRREIVYEMQKIIYTDSPEIVYYYANAFGAYRLDKFTGWVSAGITGGLLAELDGYPRTSLSIHLISAPPAPPSTEQPSILPWAAVAISVVVIVGLLGYIMQLRRRKG